MLSCEQCFILFHVFLSSLLLLLGADTEYMCRFSKTSPKTAFTVPKLNAILAAAQLLFKSMIILILISIGLELMIRIQPASFDF